MLKSDSQVLPGLHTSTNRVKKKNPSFLQTIWSYRTSYLFVTPFMICFTLFIFLPVISAILLSFTHYNSIEPPEFAGWDNFRRMLSQDLILIKHALPNTITFALIVGPGGYIAAFMLAWLISILPGVYRKWFTLAMYTPSLAGMVAMSIIWTPMLSSDRIGYLNSVLLNFGFISEPILWVNSKEYLMGSMIFVTLWKSMGIGFLAMLAGILNVNSELYEAGRLDGIRSRLEEIWYITIPATKPQMLFGAVMAVVGAIQSGGIGTALSGMNPTPQYSGHVIVTHIDDYGFTRFELGYSTALSVLLLIFIYFANKLCNKLFGTKEDE
ncbi:MULTISPECIES: carbohydrate ABC transporter permease [unclassified Paenibacillus]|uniref:carbohydrate ABC transporter permease n=1 Tax=unclassified Paenibacillus TaxID=185978 RepID=UPI00278024A1|nr:MULTISPECIES: sugar ABC transporter permease [unclassified Paenibacillus]MDQ0898473.1 multiple sugar transport system permease protein [Paenibacillus sp. V4I7]MDQ0915531.1 multiple sugar transport system permease protein [Paenibacillus sp. V4I5]